MPWNSLGTLHPTMQWQFYPVASVNTELFRIRHAWSTRPYWGAKALIGQFYATEESVFGLRRIYPSETDLELELPIPQDYKDAGIVVRSMAIKLLPPPYRLPCTHKCS